MIHSPSVIKLSLLVSTSSNRSCGVFPKSSFVSLAPFVSERSSAVSRNLELSGSKAANKSSPATCSAGTNAISFGFDASVAPTLTLLTDTEPFNIFSTSKPFPLETAEALALNQD